MSKLQPIFNTVLKYDPHFQLEYLRLLMHLLEWKEQEGTIDSALVDEIREQFILYHNKGFDIDFID